MLKFGSWIVALMTAGAGFGSASTGFQQGAEKPAVVEVEVADNAVVEIEIVEFTFQADTVRVTPGTVVRWVNRDQVAHTSTAEQGEWKSPLLGPGERFEQKFDEEGKYPYYCTPHPFMRGVVIVAP